LLHLSTSALRHRDKPGGSGCFSLSPAGISLVLPAQFSRGGHRGAFPWFPEAYKRLARSRRATPFASVLQSLGLAISPGQRADASTFLPLGIAPGRVTGRLRTQPHLYGPGNLGLPLGELSGIISGSLASCLGREGWPQYPDHRHGALSFAVALDGPARLGRHLATPGDLAASERR